jgi:hypothetical protein
MLTGETDSGSPTRGDGDSCNRSDAANSNEECEKRRALVLEIGGFVLEWYKRESSKHEGEELSVEHEGGAD